MDFQELQSVKQRFGIIGNSPKLNYAIQIAVQVAATDLSVLITGESGSGKESFSKIIHSTSHRKHGQFIAINCGAIPEGTIDSELFGHEKGAFTGASDNRKGYFEVTDGGTIFLDEIGEMPLETQARLLRVLENKEFIRVGSSKVLKTDVRVVAATNVDLEGAVRKGKFREDLYYRLNTVPINVPPLRERGDDIELLFRKFATDFAENYHVKPIALTPEARVMLLSYRFPGNIRQLKNLAEQISVLEVDRLVTGDTLQKYLPKENNKLALWSSHEDDGSLSERDILYKVLFDMRKDMNDLKKVVFKLAQTDSPGIHQVVADNPHLFHNLDEGNNIQEGVSAMSTNSMPERASSNVPSSFVYSQQTSPQSVSNVQLDDKIDDRVHTLEINSVEEVSTVDESLSLQDKEKEMIIKALKKNNNKRKYAARDLGISERTLYRKIKQYEIDE